MLNSIYSAFVNLLKCETVKSADCLDNGEVQYAHGS